MKWGWFPSAVVAVSAAKVMTAQSFDLFGDEAFYWQCGQRLAIAYADHPPLTALLVRAGSEMFGESPLGVRSLFLVLGLVLPFAIQWLAQPLVGARDARIAGALSLTLPATAFVGLIAIPDVPLLVIDAIFLGAIVRAASGGKASSWWLLVGVSGGLGFATHYRFAIAPLAVLVYFLAFRRTDWLRGPGIWVAGGLMLLGAIPTIVQNTTMSFGPVRYYLTERHGTSFVPDLWFDHLIGQLLLVSPLMYVVMLASLWLLVQESRRGHRLSPLLLIFSVAHLGLYLVAAPFEQSNAATEHWPIPGYLPLLVFAPTVLRRWSESNQRRRFWLARSAPIFGLVLVVPGLIELATGRLHLGSFREPFVGWSEAAEGGRAHLGKIPRSAESSSGRRIVVADNYKLAAQLEFALQQEAEVFVLDHHKNHLHGRAAQLETWQIDEQSLRQRERKSALVVVEVTQIRRGQYEHWLAHVGSFFTRLDLLGEVVVASPGKRRKEKIFRYFHGVERGVGLGAESGADSGDRASNP